MIQPSELAQQISHSAEVIGYSISELSGDATLPILALRKEANPSSASPFRLYLSAGIHGDEPAGPLALLQLLSDASLPSDIDIVICPLINPSGFIAKTRENNKGHDLNRDFRHPKNPETTAVQQFLSNQAPFDLSICLHEDWESHGFYLYSLAPDADQSVPRKILEAVSIVGPIDLSTEIDGSPAESGLIQRQVDQEIKEREDWPEAFYLYSKSPHAHFTTESPSSTPIEQRIKMQTVAVLQAIDLVRSKREQAPT
ncbi:hypothetical protein VDG1235_2149 [Verrucomicrobiia bacterium DG1235]|nr:hypothetical protein VDG1235_2149 [Verrucomicrobiae bacterium DG1235]